jgi:hypothetical protein
VAALRIPSKGRISDSKANAVVANTAWDNPRMTKAASTLIAAFQTPDQ